MIYRTLSILMEAAGCQKIRPGLLRAVFHLVSNDRVCYRLYKVTHAKNLALKSPSDFDSHEGFCHFVPVARAFGTLSEIIAIS